MSAPRPGPILYSFRRCPFAIRARLAIAAGSVSVEVREVNLKAKPPELLDASPKGTVPVLVLPTNSDSATGDQVGGGKPWDSDSALIPAVIDESLSIMGWALAEADPEGWLAEDGAAGAEVEALIARNDGPFKHHLDRFKYASRFPLQDREPHRAAAMAILQDWNQRLEAGGWLLGSRSSLADWALLPFVRQFRLADPAGFDSEPRLGALQAWLERFLASSELAAAMAPPLAFRQAWPSPRWIYHLALPSDWQAAREVGTYTRSTRGLDLQEVGFIHASRADQLALTHGRFYADAGPVLLLSIDPLRLRSAGITVLEEASPGSDERFPHIFGPLPLEAVVDVATYQPQNERLPGLAKATGWGQLSSGHGS